MQTQDNVVSRECVQHKQGCWNQVWQSMCPQRRKHQMRCCVIIDVRHGLERRSRPQPMHKMQPGFGTEPKGILPASLLGWHPTGEQTLSLSFTEPRVEFLSRQGYGSSLGTRITTSACHFTGQAL